jgi:cytidine deaminase
MLYEGRAGRKQKRPSNGQENAMKRMLTMLCLALAAALTAVWPAVRSASAALVREPVRVVYGFDREFPPFSFEEAGGKATGFEVELLEAIFSGRATLVPRPLQWDMVPLELAAGTITVTSGMVRTEKRSKL